MIEEAREPSLHRFVIAGHFVGEQEAGVLGAFAGSGETEFGVK